jgi:3-deoxy-7-phosphoheptulonate synthase
MIIQLEKNINANQKEALIKQIEPFGIKPNEINTQLNNYLVAVLKTPIDLRTIGNLPGIKDIHRVSDNFKLVSKKWKIAPTKIQLGNEVNIGENDFQIIAGPCSIESEEQIINTIEHLKENNIKIMRGGVFKPRSSPYDFRGLGLEGLKLFYKHCNENGIKIITEVMQVEQIDQMIDYVDIFQVGARNAQNFNLLDALGKIDKPVMLKRGISGTIDELLYAAEYVFSGGNEKILLCERGIRTYEKAYRNTFDINAIPILKEKTHLPVIADPSHGIGLRKFVDKIALAAVITGADGVMLEVHQTPEKAFSDGQQTLNFIEAKDLYNEIFKLRSALY